MQATLRSAFKRLQIGSSSAMASTSSTTMPRRSLATVVSSSYDAPSIQPQRPTSPSSTVATSPLNAATVSKKKKKSPYVVPPKVPRPPAPRYSKHSSRVKGRSPLKVRKSLNPTPDGVEFAEQGEVKIYLPSVFIRLVRNTGAHADDPYTATFRTDLRLSKPDVSNYLRNVYGLTITSLRTINYLSKMKRNPIGGGYSRAGGTKNYKKVIVTMNEPFWYPEERSRAWLNEHFERDQMEQMRDRKMLKIGDGQKYGVSSPRYRGASRSQEELEKLKKLVDEGGANTEDLETPGDGRSADRLPMGLKIRKNVMKSREERKSDKTSLVEQEMERLRAAGW
ncbi:BQ2448_797 [Microbotryum intermedium]|uniref:Large ribosomal subunit protein uL23m n=1 Tax=Microbotryum intermedium TaxID=269621 RepID=A0A238FC72_9BASI|nr:BQ2448_797 [Microbotryum intermedium]